MSWWGFLIFGLALVAATAVVVYLLVRRVRVDVDRVALAASREARTQALLEAERKKRRRLEEIAADLERKLVANREWFAGRLEEIDEDIGKEYNALLSDDDALLGRLAELLRGKNDGLGLGVVADAVEELKSLPPEGDRGEGDGDEAGRAGADGGDPPDPRHPRADPEVVREAGPDGGGAGGEDPPGRGGEVGGGGGDG